MNQPNTVSGTDQSPDWSDDFLVDNVQNFADYNNPHLTCGDPTRPTLDAVCTGPVSYPQAATISWVRRAALKGKLLVRPQGASVSQTNTARTCALFARRTQRFTKIGPPSLDRLLGMLGIGLTQTCLVQEVVL